MVSGMEQAVAKLADLEGIQTRVYMRRWEAGKGREQASMARPAPAETAASRQHQVEKMARGAASRTRGEAARWARPTGMMRMVKNWTRWPAALLFQAAARELEDMGSGLGGVAGQR